MNTCADCEQMDVCPTLGQIAANSPFVLENLKQLRRSEQSEEETEKTAADTVRL